LYRVDKIIGHLPKHTQAKQAKRDAKKAASSDLKSKIEDLLEITEENPFNEYPPYEKLVSNLEGAHFRAGFAPHR
jgi:Txe/YoeB family toxin of Txe-Axe toxin-antitoxin module